jgi:hypothetical protein
MKKLLKYLGIGILALVLFILVKTFTLSQKTVEVAAVTPIEVTDEALVRLQKAIQFKTISYSYTSKTRFDRVYRSA